MADVIKFKRGTAARWVELNPILLDGEAGFELDTGKMKIGRNNQPWSELSYVGGIDNIEIIQDVVVTYLDENPPEIGTVAYTHEQVIPETTWIINHPLSFFPSVTLVDSAKEQFEADTIVYGDGVITVTMVAAQGGEAYLS